MSFVRDQDNAIVHRETTRDNNNMATLSGTESLLSASIQHNAEMIDALTNTFVTLKKQLCSTPTKHISEKKWKSTLTSDSFFRLNVQHKTKATKKRPI